MSHYEIGGIVQLVLIFLNNGGNYKAINFVLVFFLQRSCYYISRMSRGCLYLQVVKAELLLFSKILITLYSKTSL